MRKATIVRTHDLLVSRQAVVLGISRGSIYYVPRAVIDWFSRKVLAWRLSTAMEVGFCTEAVEDAMTRSG